MKFALQYLDSVDLIVMDEVPLDFFKESNHNQASALLGGIYKGNPATKEDFNDLFKPLNKSVTLCPLFLTNTAVLLRFCS